MLVPELTTKLELRVQSQLVSVSVVVDSLVVEVVDISGGDVVVVLVISLLVELELEYTELLLDGMAELEVEGLWGRVVDVSADDSGVELVVMTDELLEEGVFMLVLVVVELLLLLLLTELLLLLLVIVELLLLLNVELLMLLLLLLTELLLLLVPIVEGPLVIEFSSKYKLVTQVGHTNEVVIIVEWIVVVDNALLAVNSVLPNSRHSPHVLDVATELAVVIVESAA